MEFENKIWLDDESLGYLDTTDNTFDSEEEDIEEYIENMFLEVEE